MQDDCIFHEPPTESVPAPTTGHDRRPAPRSRRRSAVVGGSAGRLARPETEGALTAALETARRRDRLGHDYWIVAILTSRSFLAQWSRPRSLPRRLVVVLVESDGADAPDPQLRAEDGDPSASAQSARRLYVPVSRFRTVTNLDALSRCLDRLRRVDAAGVVLLRDAEPGPTAENLLSAPLAEPRPEEDLLCASASRWSLVGANLTELVQSNPRLCWLNLTTAADRMGLHRSPLMLSAQEGDHQAALTWAAALARAGCRPVVTVPGGLLPWLSPQIARDLLQPGLPVTIVVLGSNGALGHEAVPYLLRNAALVEVSSDAEFKPALMDAVTRPGPVAVLVQAPPARAGRLGSTIGGSSRDDATSVQPATDAAREAVLRTVLTPFARSWVDAYSAVGTRPEYLWQWVQHGVDLIALSCVDEGLRRHVNDTKLLASMVNALVDDVADQQDNPPLLGALLDLVRGATADTRHLTDADCEYLEFARSAWDELWIRVREYPCSPVFEDLFRYDLQQVFNSLHYTNLVRGNLALLNRVEHDLYSPHGLMVVAFGTLDLMCSPAFPAAELGALREALWHAQWLARIGNLLCTWRREIGHGDYTDGVFVEAVERGDLSLEELRRGDARRIAGTIERGGYEESFLRRWWHHRDRLAALDERVSAVDLAQLAAGFERLLLSELGSRGWK